jgi:MFS family permease
MNIIKVSIQSSVRRPVVIILPAVLALAFFVINNYNPIMPVILGISSATGGSFFDGVISALQLIMDPSIIPGIGIFMAGVVIFASLLAGIILSGYFHIIRNTLDGIKKTKNDFKAGIKKYFLRIFVITLKATLFTGLISCIMIVAAVPAIIITRAATTTKPELMLAAIFVDILTAGVLFFGFMFSRVYLYYWYPAAIKNIEKPFIYAKRLIDKHFWKIVSRFFLFDIVFAIFIYFFIIIASAVLKLLFGWIFATVFSTVMVIYVFQSFSEIMISNGQNDRP